MFLQKEGPWSHRPSRLPGPSDGPAPRGSGEMRLKVQASASQSSCGEDEGPFNRGQAEDKAPWSRRPLLLPCYHGPLEAASPLFCQTSWLLTSKSARDLANICQDSSPHFVFVYSAVIWALCIDKLCPQGSAGAPFSAARGPTCRCTRVGVSPSTKSPASLYPA